MFLKKYDHYGADAGKIVYKDDIEKYLETSEIIIGKNIDNIINNSMQVLSVNPELISQRGMDYWRYTNISNDPRWWIYYNAFYVGSYGILQNGYDYISMGHTHPNIPKEERTTTIANYLSDEVRDSEYIREAGLNLSLQDFVSYESLYQYFTKELHKQ